MRAHKSITHGKRQSVKVKRRPRCVFRRVDVEKSTDLCDRRVIPEHISQNLCVCAVHAALGELQSVVAAEIPDVVVRVHEGGQGVFRDPVSPGMHLCYVQQSRENKHGKMRNSHQTIEVRTLDGTHTHCLSSLGP